MHRALYSHVQYPGDYGFVAGTLADDGEPVDVLVVVEEASLSGWLDEVRPIGIMDMIDQDQTDQKILAVPNRNPRYDEIHTMDQIFIHVRREIEHFFTIYKELEGRTTTTLGWKGPAEARRVIVEARKSYLAKKSTLT